MQSNTGLEINFNDDFYNFIKNNINNDVNKLRLKKYQDISFDSKFAITQIECLNKATAKIPEILNLNPKFIFPSSTVAEQCTTEIIAKYHATLFDCCKTVLDMTAGLCIDSYYISKIAKSVTALEIDTNCAMVNELNMKDIAPNIDVICCDSGDYIKNKELFYDAIFIDPARRGHNKNRVYALSDCSPNVLELMQHIKAKSNYVIIKASPMLDITDTLKQIDGISDIWIIGIKNECKEMLIKVDFTCDISSTKIHTINYEGSSTQEFSYTFEDIPNSTSPLSIPSVRDYLYEPNSCIMKCGAFKELNALYEFSKLHNNTHLFISKNIFKDFPGRVFVIDEIIPFKDKLIKKLHLQYPKVNISVRNFKLTAEQLKTKLKVNDGGNVYLFGVTLQDNSLALLLCHKPTS